MTSRILIVEDEPDIQDMIAMALERAGFSTLRAADGQIGFAAAIDHRPSLMLIDWMMPGVNGIELLRRLKRDERTRHIPVIMLSAKAETDNKSQGLDTGADDYLAKPFSPKELVSRIHAVLRRYEGNDASKQAILTVRELTLNDETHQVAIAGQDIAMGPTEYRLLKFFMSHPNKVYSREQLLDQVWGNAVYIDERTVDVHIRRVRKAISIHGHDELIQTVRGSGYRFSEQ